MEKFIDLELQEVEVRDKDEKDKHEITNRIYTLKEIIDKYKIVIILGNPGSGKTSILKKYEQEHKDSRFVTAKNFRERDEEDYSNVNILLIDAVDEHRGIGNQSTNTIEYIGYKVNNLFSTKSDLKVIITCRDMDWYGLNDEKALENELKKKQHQKQKKSNDEKALKDESKNNNEIGIVNLLPLSNKLQKEFAQFFNIKDVDNFFKKFENTGFLQNPQMLKMAATIYNEDVNSELTSKNNILEQYIESSMEHNPNHKNQLDIEKDKFLSTVGYIAFFYIFSNINEFDENFINNIANSDNGYPKESIEKALRSKIFNEKTFSHKTIAEFALSKFIYKSLYKNEQGIPKNRLLDLFSKEGKIPTALRGVYSWFCSISKDIDFIKIDPFYQLVYGDCSLYDLETKKEIFFAIKELSKTNPYFIQNIYNYKFLDNFYDEKLDDILIAEFEITKNLNSRFRHFIAEIIAEAQNLSEKIKEFVKKELIQQEIQINFDVLKIFKDDKDFLLKLLDLIKDNKITDNKNYLKSKILKYLYPNYISNKELAQYLPLYKQPEIRIIGQIDFLYKIKFEDKFELINEICQLDKEQIRYLYEWDLKYFIYDYFYELITKYKNGMNAQGIFDTLIHFYNLNERMGYEYRNYFIEKPTILNENLQQLSNELFDLFVEYCISRNNIRNVVYNFYNFFTLKDIENVGELILKKINKSYKKEINESLFETGFMRLPEEKRNSSFLQKLSEKFNLKKLLYDLQNPPKPLWDIREMEKKEKYEQEKKERTESNEKYFADKQDEEILNNIGDLYFIAKFIYFRESGCFNIEDCLTDKTAERLKELLKKIIYLKPIDKTVFDIYDLEMPTRDIDIVYASSIYLNNDSFDLFKIEDKKFLKYLYLISIFNTNLVSKKFIVALENKDMELCINTIKEYLICKIKKNITDKNNKIFIDLIENENNIDILKIYSYSFSHKDINNFLNDILLYNGFGLDINKLEKIKLLYSSDDNQLVFESILSIIHNDKNDFNVEKAFCIYEKFFENRDINDKLNNFAKINSDLRARIVEFIISFIDYNENRSVFDFNISNLLSFLNLKELKSLLSIIDDRNFWYSSILNQINRLKQEKTDNENTGYDIEKIKNFIFNYDVLSKKDFFEDICLKLESLKTEIEDNRNNDKNAFYNGANKKCENDCRDEIYKRLNDKYDNYIDLKKESIEANNRVDINIRDKKTLKFEVQVECKKDDNQELYAGIKNQLIDKYFTSSSSNVEHGIYLVFYFGQKNNKSSMIEKLNNSIPAEFKEKIKVICIDLTK